MAITTIYYKTIENPIPTWKGTDALPDILTISGEAPPISGGPSEIIDFHCAETFDRDGGITNVSEDPDVIMYELVTGTKYDDQT